MSTKLVQDDRPKIKDKQRHPGTFFVINKYLAPKHRFTQQKKKIVQKEYRSSVYSLALLNTLVLLGGLMSILIGWYNLTNQSYNRDFLGSSLYTVVSCVVISIGACVIMLSIGGIVIALGIMKKPLKVG